LGTTDGSEPRPSSDDSYGGSFPLFPGPLVQTAKVLRSRGQLAAADIDVFWVELGLYAQQLRRAGVPRDRIVAAVWPLFVGAESSHLVENALDSCVSAYDRADEQDPISTRRG
jgi:hypothetical protein